MIPATDINELLRQQPDEDSRGKLATTLADYNAISQRMRVHDAVVYAKANLASEEDLPLRMEVSEFARYEIKHQSIATRRLVPDATLRAVAGQQATPAALLEQEGLPLLRDDGLTILSEACVTPIRDRWVLAVRTTVPDEELPAIVAWAVATQRLKRERFIHTRRDVDALASMLVGSSEVP